MKRLLILLLLTSCTKNPDPEVYEVENGWMVEYEGKHLFTDNPADTTQMKIEIVK